MEVLQHMSVLREITICMNIITVNEQTNRGMVGRERTLNRRWYRNGGVS